MIYAIFFASGLGLGFALGCISWAGIYTLAKKVAESKYKADVLRMQQEGILTKRHLEEVKKKVVDIYGPNLTERHKEVLSEELASVLTKPRG